MSRDEAWFDGFYREHERTIHAFCVRRVGVGSAEDAVAQVFAVAWRRRDSVPAGDAGIRWLYGVAHRVLSHHWRGQRRAARLVARAGTVRRPSVATPELAVVSSAEHELVRRAVRGLRPLDREVLMLSAWEGLTHAEIADVLGVSLPAVDKRVARAKVRLAERYTALTAPTSQVSSSTSVERKSPVRAREGGGAP